jgi:lipopolysaccharide transport system ATP-binding protein
MSSELVIECRGVSKTYQLYRRHNDRLKQLLFGRYRRYFIEYWALSGIDLAIRRGERIGIVGRNGAGKSTFLQLVCGITLPTAGELIVDGRVAPILALGSGFNPEMTGRENAQVSGSILGLRRAQVAARMDSIADFAGIGDFMHQPVRLYSAGMRSRLAFAICAHVDADILVVDEALSVGDGTFRQKCMDFIARFSRSGTLILASHEMDQVRELCDRVIWIDAGKVRAEGKPDEIVGMYLEQSGDDPESKRFHFDPNRLPLAGLGARPG